MSNADHRSSFCMYRLRTADKGRPIIISDKVIQDYSETNVDTLHKKNLFSLGEDRYLTTIMSRHFPTMSYKFVPDAYALTEAPSEWSVLLSQRRRWINSTIHNLAELVFLKDLCGFCCFSMRFVVFVDLFGTLTLPATCGYLGYLIYRVASHTGQFPLISIVMIAVVYGLQAIIFLIKRQWQHIGWMIIYLLAFPIHSFILPVYSFWRQDDFSWGNTRVVIGEKGDKKVVAVADEGYDPRSVPLQRWDHYATANNLPGRRGMPQEKDPGMYQEGGYEMDDMHSTYSSVKPASTILTGFPHQQMYSRPAQSPGPYNAFNRQSTFSRYTDMPVQQAEQTRLMSMGGMSEHYNTQPPPNPFASRDTLMLGAQTPPLYSERDRSPYNNNVYSRPGSTANLTTLSGFQTQGPTNDMITHAIRECLGEVDLDSVTKKQLKALAEQKLQCQLSGEKRAFLDSQIDFELARNFPHRLDVSVRQREERMKNEENRSSQWTAFQKKKLAQIKLLPFWKHFNSECMQDPAAAAANIYCMYMTVQVHHSVGPVGYLATERKKAGFGFLFINNVDAGHTATVLHPISDGRGVANLVLCTVRTAFPAHHRDHSFVHAEQCLVGIKDLFFFLRFYNGVVDE
nr:chitin synthase 6 [Quercus suber]